jgi:predicted phosphoserine aminotransferase
VDHVKLFIPGPTEVRREVLDAQGQWMIGHRGKDFETLFARIQPKLRQLFYTASRVYISTSSGTGLQEAAVRNCVRRRCLNVVNGAFSLRWHEVTAANGKEAVRFDVPLGEAITPEQLDDALQRDPDIDAVTLVHNETSTGVATPLAPLAEVVRARPDVMLLVDAVSSLGGMPIEVDALGLDVCLTSTQKALALPPGLALGAVSDRALERARSVPARGLYFDFVDLEKFLLKNNTPATPAISLMYALDCQLDRMLAEGLEDRFARHAAMAARVQQWAGERYALFAAEGFRSHTVTCITNTRALDIAALNRSLRAEGMQIGNGYGTLKDKTFRIAHMGDLGLDEIDVLLAAIDRLAAGVGDAAAGEAAGEARRG